MIKRNCKQCGKEFVLSDSEIKFFKDKNLDLPKRCSECRKENKNNSSNKNSNKNDNINSNKNGNINNKNVNNKNVNNTDLNRSTTIKDNSNHNGKGKTVRNIIIAGLVLVVLLIGKLFNIELNWTDIGRTSENGQSTNASFQFRNDQLLDDHFLKHGNEFGYKSKEEYVEGANEVIKSPDSKHKTEAEDGDEIYYNENKNEIVFVSTDGYIRTYFKPNDGINYFNRQ
ncbi:zinc-ribbon domain containing protein [Clostridium sp. D53t1_180928_C8]|uniref:zinc-ribbon domain containing protein n=1 Tax=Clostridium sp. D53t1_180928_C8 TaxID=2787101 RepID=UPI0018A903E3